MSDAELPRLAGLMTTARLLEAGVSPGKIRRLVQQGVLSPVGRALKYADPQRAVQQLRRDAKLRDAGFQVVHFTWYEIVQVPRQVAESLRRAFERGAAG